MPYPTATELALWMVGQRLLSAIPTDLTVLEGALAGAISAFEGDTFWTPFLAGEEETRKFDGPEGYNLYPGVGIVSVTTLRVGGTLLVEDFDYFLQDRKNGRYAYQRVEFSGWVSGARRVVEIVGVFGLVTTIPADVALAILSKAAAGISNDATASGAIKKETAGPVTYEYDVAAGATTKTSQLEGTYGDTVTRWKRRV